MSLGFIVILIGVLLLVAFFFSVLGAIIYKDAQTYGLPPLKWALIAVFVPNLIGVVIYLVARSKIEKALYCSNCMHPVEKDYNLCPNCATVFENICQVCKKALKSEHEICPYCGSTISSEQLAKTGIKIAKKTKLTRNLIVLCVCYFIIMIGSLIAILGFGVDGYVMNLDIDDVFVSEWRSGISTISIDRSSEEKVDHYFHFTTEVTSRKLKVYADETPQIDIEVAFEAGEIEVQILNEKQEPIFEKTYVGSLDSNGKAKVIQDSILVKLSEDQVYNVKFIYRKAKSGTIKMKG